jgi:hypothetical protein
MRTLINYTNPEINDHVNFQWPWKNLNSWSLKYKPVKLPLKIILWSLLVALIVVKID